MVSFLIEISESALFSAVFLLVDIHRHCTAAGAPLFVGWRGYLLFLGGWGPSAPISFPNPQFENCEDS